ncbi:MAG: type II toxin-antitoxin system RelE/ParE family toxin [Chloroflexota bacterium]|jgi:mRNA interferase RelE/StbE
MANYKLVFKKSVTKDLRPILNTNIKRILQRIEALATDPRPVGCEKLSGQDKYRVRQGIYRIIYEIKDEELIITIIKIGHRRDIYKNK